MHRRIGLWISAGAAVALAAPVAAQRQVQVTPFVAAYYAPMELGNVVTEPFAGFESRVLQNGAPAFGAAVSLQLNDVFGVELSSAYSFSEARVEVCDPGTDVCSYQDQESSLIVSALVARLRPRRSNLILTGGLALVSRSGDVWADLESKHAPGGTVGIGVRAQVAPKISLEIRADAVVYALDPDGAFTDWESALVTDVLVRIGIPLPGR